MDPVQRALLRARSNATGGGYMLANRQKDESGAHKFKLNKTENKGATEECCVRTPLMQPQPAALD